MNHPQEIRPDLDEGIDRKVLATLRARFLTLNQGRLQRAMEGLSTRQQQVLTLLPLLAFSSVRSSAFMWTARFSASEAINSARSAGSAEVSARPCPQVCGFSMTDLLFTAFVPVISWQRRRAWCGWLWPARRDSRQ